VLQPGIYQIHFTNSITQPISGVNQQILLSLNGTTVESFGAQGQGANILISVSQVNTVLQLTPSQGDFLEFSCQLAITRTL